MPPGQPDFVFVPADEASELVAAGMIEPGWKLEQLVRRRPPAFEPEDVVKVPRFLVDHTAGAARQDGSRGSRRRRY